MRWMERFAGIAVLTMLAASTALGAGEITYEKDIRRRCCRLGVSY